MISAGFSHDTATDLTQKLTLHSETTEQSTYAVARLLMKLAHDFCKLFGVQNNQTIFIAVYAIIVFLIAFFTGWIVKMIVVFFLRHIHFKRQNSLYNILVNHRFFIKISSIIPPIVFLVLIQFTLYTHVSIASGLTRLSWMYVVCILAIACTTLADCIWEHLDNIDNTRKLPLRGIVQITKLIIWIIAVIIMTALLINKSPGTLLAGLGAFAAVLMLIFKDSILGVVAGVQLSQNDSLHVGDWIAVKNTDANGTVAEVSLTAVKIINWDLTVSTVPPYTLITNGFTNYRNMQESHTRRIQRSYYIDADSVVETDDEMIESFRSIPLMKDWIDAKVRQRNEGKVQDVDNSEGLVNGTIDTNLGMFRAYLQLYLENNPNLSHEPQSTCFVTTLAQTSAGIPLQIYCFTATSAWLSYEAIQAAVFEHLAVMMHRFHLYVFENPSGRDTIIEGYLSPGKNPKFVNGVPYPFFQDTGTPMNPGIPPEGLYAKTNADHPAKPTFGEPGHGNS